MYQDEMDMMDIELLGRERQARLAAERAAAETSGRAELARVQASLQATEQKLDIAKKRLYFPAVKGFGWAFVSGFSLSINGGPLLIGRNALVFWYLKT